MQILRAALAEQPVVYVTRDIERALGLPASTKGYHIISNATPFAKKVAGTLANVLLIESPELLDTHELLEHEATREYLSRLTDPRLLVFKPTAKIERICRENTWRLLNPPAALANKIEEKISQVAWLGELARYLPPHEIKLGRELVWNDTAYIVQFNRAHTGSGTLYISHAAQVEELRRTFPDRPMRLTRYIQGPVITVNVVVADTSVLIGNISYQITGLEPFTDNPFATVGNDWKLGRKLLTETQKKYFAEMIEVLGNKLREAGWSGLFGVDLVIDETDGTLYLLEINARQPASTTFESELQRAARQETELTTTMTTFETHLAALLKLDGLDHRPTDIEDGAQIVVRNRADRKLSEARVEDIKAACEAKGYTVITYPNTKPNSDRLRIQSRTGFIAAPGKLNELGLEIAEAISHSANTI